MRDYASFTSKYFSNPYSFNRGGYNEDIVKRWMERQLQAKKAEEEAKYRSQIEKRGLLDRSFDFLLTPASVVSGFADGLVKTVKGESWTTPYKQAWKAWSHGINAINPFNNDTSEKDEYSFSRVMETAGWKPTSTIGKIAKGTIGFGLDVVLDPTTYLTGGASALVKGTGRVGKTASKIDELRRIAPELKMSNEQAELVAKGINPDLAQRFVARNKEAYTKQFAEITHMTEDIAQEYIKKRSYARGFKIPQEEMVADAKRLAETFNKALGIRDVGKAQGITFGIENLPFIGEAIVKKTGFGKAVQLSDGTRVRALSDKLKISNGYSALRANIYGRKLGELFSTTTPLYRLSMEDPTKLYDLVKFMEMTRGKYAKKVEADKAVRDFAKSMKFTPSETKDIMKLMQDKTVWGKVAKTLKFTETARGKEFRSALRHTADTLEGEYATAIEKKRTYEQMLDLLEEGVVIKQDALQDLLADYRKTMKETNVADIKNPEQRVETMKALREEIGRIDAEISRIGKKEVNNEAIEVKDFDELLAKVKEEEKLMKDYREAKRTKDKAQREASSAKDADQFKNFEDSIKPKYDGEMIRHMDDAPTQGAKKELTAKLSQHIFGDANKIDGDVPMEMLTELADMAKRGYPIEILRGRVESNIGLFSEHAQEVYKFLARKYGYRSFDEAYTKKMKVLEDFRKGGGIWSDEQTQEYFKLRLLMRDRNEDFEKFFVNMSYEDFKAVRLEQSNKELVDELAEVLLTERPLSASMMDEMTDVFDRPDRTAFYRAEKEQARAEVTAYYRDYINRTLGDVKGDFSPQMMNDIERITKEMEKVFVEMHPNRSYYDLTSKQREFVKNIAIYRTSKNAQQTVDPVVMKKLVVEANRRKDMVRMETVLDSVKEGHLIRFQHDGSEVEGVVDFIQSGDSGTLYRTRIDGEVVEVPLRDVLGARLTKVDATTDEIIESSRLTKDLLKQREEFAEELSKLENASSALTDKGLIEERKAIVKVYRERMNKSRDLIKEQQELAQKTREALYKLDDEVLNENQKRLMEIEDALLSDDALESYARLMMGEEMVEGLIRKEMGDDYFKVALDDMDYSDEVKTWAKALRAEYQRIGIDEKSIGHLTEGQFYAMTDHYLPHVLTEDGAKYLRDQGVIANPGLGLTTDFGFGQKRSPYSLSRTIQGKTIEEINEHFSEALKGKNFFSENLADIYIARALKHNEIMYDERFSNSMMMMFGNLRVPNTVGQEGFKPVMHYGQFRKHIRKLVSDEAKAIRKEGGNVNQEVFEELARKNLEFYKLPKDILDSSATPMLELSEEQVVRLSQAGLVYDVQDSIIQKANQARKLQIAKDQSRFLTIYDKFLHLMKLNQTTVMPSFHARNKVSNMFLNWLEIGRDAIDPRMQRTVWQVARHRGDAEKLKSLRPLEIKSEDGAVRVMHWDEIYDLAMKYNVVDEGFFAQDIGAGSATKGVFKKLNPKYDPTDSENFVPYRVGAKIGTQIENSDRLLHFASQLKRGLDPESASESSRKFLFDYSDLTEFEKTYMKRVLPYYTWMRKNGRLQLSQLVEKPGRYRDVAKVQQGINNSNNDEEKVDRGFIAPFARDWVQSPMSVLIPGSQTEENPEGTRAPIMMNPNMPFQDLGRLPNPMEPVLTMYNLLAQSSPQIKVPLELALNRSFFFDEPIAEEDESRVLQSLDHLGKQFAVYNAGEGFVSKEGAGLGLHALNTATGVKGVAYDEKTMKNMQLKELFEREESEFSKFADALKDKVTQGAVGFATNSVQLTRSLFRKGAIQLVGQPPTDASEYEGALRPISSTSYEKLSDKEKAKYTAPTKEDATAYSKKARALEKKEYEKSGVAKRFVWTLLDMTSDKPKSKIGYVTKVSDGDTFITKIGDKEEEVRMILIDTPETVHPDKPVMPMGEEASTFSKDMLFGKDVRLVFEGDERDAYGRLLAYVEVDDKDYGAELLKRGLAKVRYKYKDFPNDTQEYSRTDDYFDAEERSAKRKRGIWQEKYEGYAEPGKDEDYRLDAVSRYLKRRE